MLINARQLDTSPIPYVVDRMIPLVGGGFGHGPSGAGKSYALVTRLGLDVANGVPYFGRDTIQGPVILCLGEGQQDAGIRIKAQLAQHHQDNADQIAAVFAEQGEEAAAKFALSLPSYTDDYLIVSTEPFVMPVERNGKPSASMRQAIATMDGIHPVLIILDALADFAGGSSITNDTAASRYVAGLKYLIAQMDCAVLVIGHDTESGEKMLGAGRFRNGADFMFRIKPEPGDGCVSTVISEKSKSGPGFAPFSYMALPKVWDEPILDENGDPTGETGLVETNVVSLLEDDDSAFVLPTAAMATPTLTLPGMRDATAAPRKRTGIRPGGTRTAPGDRDKLIADLLSGDCLECGAPPTRSCNPLPGSEYATIAPGTDVHMSRADAAVTAGVVSLDRLLAQCPAIAS